MIDFEVPTGRGRLEGTYLAALEFWRVLAPRGEKNIEKTQVRSAFGTSWKKPGPLRVRVCFAEQKLASRTPWGALLRELEVVLI